MRLHPHAAGLVAILDPGWRRKLWLGGLLLLVPVLGWPALLGFRTGFVRHLFTPGGTALPAWDDGLIHHAREGLKALCVIFGYLLPLVVALGVVVARRGYVPDASALLLGAFFIAFPIFSTLSFPVACVALAHGPGAWLTQSEMLVGLSAYVVVVFLLPAGFLQVSLTRRYLSAFALWRTIPFVLANLPAYLEAWWLSGLMSLAGHLALPLSPWGVAWCYLAIVLLFNEILHTTGLAPGDGWLQRAVTDPRFQGGRRLGFFELVDGGAEPVTVLDLRLFSVPLPRAFARGVHVE